MRRVFACLMLLLLALPTFGGGRQVSQRRRSRAKKPAAKKLPTPTVPFTAIPSAPLEPANEVEAAITSFVELFDSFALEVVNKVEAGRGTVEGVARAQQYLEARSEELKKRFDEVKCVPSLKVSSRFAQRLSEHFMNDGIMMGQLHAKYDSDPAVKAALQKLTMGFLDIVSMRGACPGQDFIALRSQ